jgi:hypothetical protein
VLIPFPEAHEVLLRRERKDAEQASRAHGRRKRYRVFFQEIIDRLREDHAFNNVRVAQPHGWYAFAPGTSGISFSVSFSWDAFRVEIYIDVGSREEYKRFFGALHAQADEIQSSIELPICWERIDERRASRIAIHRDVTIDDSDEELAQTRDCAIENLPIFRALFGPRLAKIV